MLHSSKIKSVTLFAESILGGLLYTVTGAEESYLPDLPLHGFLAQAYMCLGNPPLPTWIRGLLFTLFST